MKLKDNKFDIIIDLICIVCLALATISLMMAWSSLASHGQSSSSEGLAGAFNGRGSFLLLLGIGWLIFIVFSIVEHFPSMWSIGSISISRNNEDKVYRIFKNLLGVTKLITTALFAYLTFRMISGSSPTTMFYNIVTIVLLSVVFIFSIQMILENRK